MLFELYPVLILVVVADIQLEALKTEVEQGSMWTVFGYGLAGTKDYLTYLTCFAHGLIGKSVNNPELENRHFVVTKNFYRHMC